MSHELNCMYIKYPVGTELVKDCSVETLKHYWFFYLYFLTCWCYYYKPVLNLSTFSTDANWTSVHMETWRSIVRLFCVTRVSTVVGGTPVALVQIKLKSLELTMCVWKGRQWLNRKSELLDIWKGFLSPNTLLYLLLVLSVPQLGFVYSFCFKGSARRKLTCSICNRKCSSSLNLQEHRKVRCEQPTISQPHTLLWIWDDFPGLSSFAWFMFTVMSFLSVTPPLLLPSQHLNHRFISASWAYQFTVFCSSPLEGVSMINFKFILGDTEPRLGSFYTSTSPQSSTGKEALLADKKVLHRRLASLSCWCISNLKMAVKNVFCITKLNKLSLQVTLKVVSCFRSRRQF